MKTSTVEAFKLAVASRPDLLEALSETRAEDDFVTTCTEVAQSLGLELLAEDIQAEIHADRANIEPYLTADELSAIAGRYTYKQGTSTSNWACCGGTCK